MAIPRVVIPRRRNALRSCIPYIYISTRSHAFLRKLLDCFLVLGEMRQSHATQHVRRLAELNIVVADDLDAVAPWIPEIEKRAGQRFDTGSGQRLADRLLVIDHETEMAAVVGGLLPPLLQREELVAEIDEGRRLALAPKLEIEQAAVERQGRIDVTDLESDVIETDGARFS